MRDILLQAYKDRKELKTTYIFYSWSFKSRFLKEDFCCFSFCAWFGILFFLFFFLHINQSRAAEFPLFLFTVQPGADAMTPGFPDFFMRPVSAHQSCFFFYISFNKARSCSTAQLQARSMDPNAGNGRFQQ